MPRAIWSGSITFGLVNIPVKVYSAVSPKSVRFHQLHATDGARVEQHRVCSADGEEVPYEEIVKGYKVGPDQYVPITPEELEALAPEKSQTIDIQEFVDIAEIDPLHFERSYYLVPDKGAGKSYGLLVEAMRRSGRVGLARTVMRTKEYLVAVRAIEDALTMTTLYHADEVVPPESIEPLAEAKARPAPSERELEMAETLIGALTASFEPEKYHDEHRERILELIEQKAEGREVVVPPAAPTVAPAADLERALEASLEAARKRQKAEG